MALLSRVHDSKRYRTHRSSYLQQRMPCTAVYKVRYANGNFQQAGRAQSDILGRIGSCGSPAGLSSEHLPERTVKTLTLPNMLCAEPMICIKQTGASDLIWLLLALHYKRWDHCSYWNTINFTLRSQIISFACTTLRFLHNRCQRPNLLVSACQKHAQKVRLS